MGLFDVLFHGGLQLRHLSFHGTGAVFAPVTVVDIDGMFDMSTDSFGYILQFLQNNMEKISMAEHPRDFLKKSVDPTSRFGVDGFV